MDDGKQWPPRIADHDECRKAGLPSVWYDPAIYADPSAKGVFWPRLSILRLWDMPGDPFRDPFISTCPLTENNA